jgi:hypothetical protein
VSLIAATQVGQHLGLGEVPNLGYSSVIAGRLCQAPLPHGRGCGVGRTLGPGAGRGVGVGRGVEVAVAVGVGVGTS